MHQNQVANSTYLNCYFEEPLNFNLHCQLQHLAALHSSFLSGPIAVRYELSQFLLVWQFDILLESIHRAAELSSPSLSNSSDSALPSAIFQYWQYY